MTCGSLHLLRHTKYIPKKKSYHIIIISYHVISYPIHLDISIVYNICIYLQCIYSSHLQSIKSRSLFHRCVALPPCNQPPAGAGTPGWLLEHSGSLLLLNQLEWSLPALAINGKTIEKKKKNNDFIFLDQMAGSWSFALQCLFLLVLS